MLGDHVLQHRDKGTAVSLVALKLLELARQGDDGDVQDRAYPEAPGE